MELGFLDDWFWHPLRASSECWGNCEYIRKSGGLRFAGFYTLNLKLNNGYD